MTPTPTENKQRWIEIGIASVVAAAALVGIGVSAHASAEAAESAAKSAKAASVAASQENLVIAQRTAWGQYLGVLDELARVADGIQPSNRTDINNVLADRWAEAYPQSKQYAAQVRLLVDPDLSDKIFDAQNDLSRIEDYLGDQTQTSPPGVNVWEIYINFFAAAQASLGAETSVQIQSS